VLCLSCHGPAGVATKKAEVHKNKDGSSHAPFFMTCTDCHNPHDNMGNRFGGTNLAQVGKKLDGTGDAMIPTPNSGDRYVVFESRGTDAGGPSLYSFADNDEDGDSYYDGACETCHTQALNHRNNSSGNHSHYTGTNCIACHPHDGFFHGSGGGCPDCHSAIFSKFDQVSHHVAAATSGTVSEDDCQVCHQEPTSNHQDGFINLKHPDTGAAVTPFPKGSTRNTSILPSAETWAVLDVQDFCLACHDNNGATNTEISGNALRPFSVGAKDVPDANTQFSSSDYHHAVLQNGTNPYCDANTMASPWTNHDKITCFDCHEFTGHGSAYQRMLLDPIDFDTMETATTKSDLPAGMGLTVETFCSRCHLASEYVVGDSNSKFEYHGANQNQHRAAGGNELGCLGCHGGIVDLSEIAGNGSARGNIHGGSYTWPPSGTWSPNSVTKFFIVGGWISGWEENHEAGMNGCAGGECAHTGSIKRQEPGKDYTN
jgi:hypothetical protein